MRLIAKVIDNDFKTNKFSLTFLICDYNNFPGVEMEYHFKHIGENI